MNFEIDPEKHKKLATLIDMGWYYDISNLFNNIQNGDNLFFKTTNEACAKEFIIPSMIEYGIIIEDKSTKTGYSTPYTAIWSSKTSSPAFKLQCTKSNILAFANQSHPETNRALAVSGFINKDKFFSLLQQQKQLLDQTVDSFNSQLTEAKNEKNLYVQLCFLSNFEEVN